MPHDSEPNVSRRQFFAGFSVLATSTRLLASPDASVAGSRKWPRGINTYCLRFQRWNDRQLVDYCVKHKLNAIFLQDSLDPATMDPQHWAEVRAWTKEAGLHIETGGGAILPASPE